MNKKTLVIGGLAILLVGNLALLGYMFLRPNSAGLPLTLAGAATPSSDAFRLPPSWTPTQPPSPVESATASPATDTPATVPPAVEAPTFALGSAEEAAQANLADDVLWVNQIMNAEHQVVIASSEPLLWGKGWCASTQEILDANFELMTAQLFVNGETIEPSYYSVRDYGNTGPEERTYCRSHFVLVRSWPTGVTTLKGCYLITQRLNDGWSDYDPGYSCSNFIVELAPG